MRYNAVPYTEGLNNGERFYVRADTPRAAVELAKAEAEAQGYGSVFVEDESGRMVHDG